MPGANRMTSMAVSFPDWGGLFSVAGKSSLTVAALYRPRRDNGCGAVTVAAR